MSIGAGAVTLKRLQILKSGNEIPLEWIVEKLLVKTIQPLGFEDDTRESASGWCHPFSGEGTLPNIDELVFDNCFIFGMRTDSKKVPGTLLRLQMKAALDAMNQSFPADDGKTKKRRSSSKTMKDAAKERIKTELLRRTLPSIRLVEIVWHLDSGELWLSSSSPGVVGEFEKLFFETFELPFVHRNAGTSAVDFDRINSGSEVSLQMLYDLTPVDLIRGVDVPNLVDSNEQTSTEQPYF